MERLRSELTCPPVALIIARCKSPCRMPDSARTTDKLETPMLIWGRKHFHEHRLWAFLVMAVTLAFSGWFLAELWRDGRWPSGGSLAGMVAGCAAASIMTFEMLLWPRKTVFRAWRIGRTKHWLKAHHWLGILVLPLSLLHGGFHFDLSRSPLAATLSWLTLIVVVSGVFGAVLQQVLPTRMLETLPGETIVDQIPEVLEAYRKEAEKMVRETCGVGVNQDEFASSMEVPIQTVSSIRTKGMVSGRTVQVQATFPFVPGCETLLTFWESRFDPFLVPEKMSKIGLGDSRTAEATFQALFVRIPTDAHPVVARLEMLCRQRRQFERQRQMHFWLHSWLVGHVAASVAMMCTLVLHVYFALQYP